MLTFSVKTGFITLDMRGLLHCLYWGFQHLHLLIPCAIFIFVTGVHEDLIISPLIFQEKKC